MDNNIEQYISPATPAEQLGLSSAELQQSLKLAGLLQTSLHIYDVIGYFIDTVRQIVPFDSVDYSYIPLSVKVVNGRQQRHHCTYRLNVAAQSMGTLIFSRKRRFSEQDMETLENLICQLIFPLRNAIWYQNALLSAQNDALTGAMNRYAYDQGIAREVDKVKRYGSDLSLVVLDVDHFKQINDKYGHGVGDEVLVEIARRIRKSLRLSDSLYRYGGEEFVILLPGCKAESTHRFAERIRNVLVSEPVSTSHGDITVTASLGTAACQQNDTPERLFARADAALYHAKNIGRNRVISEALMEYQGITA